jgi:general L-amino acid transport system substrate-binding protein
MTTTKLEDILARGYLKVGIRKVLHPFITDTGDMTTDHTNPPTIPVPPPAGFEPELARGLAVMLFNDPDAIDWYWVQTSAERFSLIREDTVDIVLRAVTHTASRDAWNGEGVDYSPVYYFDFAQIWSKTSDDLGQLDDPAFRVGCKSSVYGALEGWRLANGYTFTSVSLPDYTPALKAAWDGETEYDPPDPDPPEPPTDPEPVSEVDAVYSDGTVLLGLELTDPHILDIEVTDEPLAAVIKAGESEWGDVVKWFFYTLLEAEERGINSTNACFDVDVNVCDGISIPSSQGGYFGEDIAHGLGLDPFFARRVINAIGNYGELHDLIHPPVARGYNNLWNYEPIGNEPQGLMYSPTFG